MNIFSRRPRARAASHQLPLHRPDRHHLVGILAGAFGGATLVDGSLAVDELRRRFELPPLPGEEDEDYQTLGGFMFDRFGYIPRAGEHFACHGWRFEIMDMDRHRVEQEEWPLLWPRASPTDPVSEVRTG